MKRIFVCCLLLALLACVPTPEQEIVVNRADGVLEDIIHPTEEPTHTAATLPNTGTNAPSPDATAEATPISMKETRWEESFSVAAAMDRLDVFVDADVRYPESGTAPVYRIGYLPQDDLQVYTLLRTFFGDGQVFLADRTKTKAYYKAQMARYVAEKDKETDEAVRTQWQMLLDRAAKDYADAPDAQQATVWDGTVGDDVDLMAENGDGTYRYLHLTNQRISYADALDTTYYVRNGMNRTVETDEERAALQCGTDLLNALGIDAAFAGIRSTKESVRAFGSRIEDGYVLYFDPLYGGLPVTAERVFHGFDEAIAAAGGSSEPDYVSHYEDEELSMVIVGDHIESFCHAGVPHILQTENGAAALLSFERIQDLFRSDIGKVMFVNKGQPMKLNVHTMRLTMCRVPIENSQTEFYLLPVWEFLAAVDTGTPATDAALQSVCVLRLNALDGSIVH